MLSGCQPKLAFPTSGDLSVLTHSVVLCTQLFLILLRMYAFSKIRVALRKERVNLNKKIACAESGCRDLGTPLRSRGGRGEQGPPQHLRAVKGEEFQVSGMAGRGERGSNEGVRRREDTFGKKKIASYL